MTGKRCNDNRCLYSSLETSSPKSFHTVTTQTREGQGLWEKCNRCGLVINRSGVEPDQVEIFYNTKYVEKNSYSAGDLLSAQQHFDQRIDSVRVIAQALEPYLTPNSRVFELGAATGELLYLIRDRVKYCFANEINQLFTVFIRTELHIDASHENYLQLEMPEPFDVIISINTIDHIFHPLHTLEKIYRNLKPGGTLYLEVPNDAQALNRYLPDAQQAAFTKFMYQKAHYYSFTLETLRSLLRQVGFQVEREMSRHDYTLNNFLQWYFLGRPQKELKSAMLATDLFAGTSSFEKAMNRLFAEFNTRFKEAMAEHQVGETICMIAHKREENR